MDISNNCLYDDLVRIDSLNEHSFNRNQHPENQIKMLAKLLEYQGWRHPIIVSKNSNSIVAGHGRLLAAKYLGLEVVPVSYQEFDDDEMEYAFIQSDNAIANWSSLDLDSIKNDIIDFSENFDFDLLGIQKFSIDEIDETQKTQKIVDVKFDYKLEVDCESEEKQQQLYEELENRGFKIRILI